MSDFHTCKNCYWAFLDYIFGPCQHKTEYEGVECPEFRAGEVEAQEALTIRTYIMNDCSEPNATKRGEMYEDQVKVAIRWLRYFARPDRRYAKRSTAEYARRVSVWAGEYISPEAFKDAADRLNYSGVYIDGNYFIKAKVTS